MKYIHELAKIDNDVIIGNDTKIWHWTHVSSGAKIGDNCILGQNVFIGKNVTIGNNVKIQNNVSIFEGVELGDKVFCGPSVVFTNVINPRSFINKKKEFQPTKVLKGVTIGANSTIICGINIDEYAFVGAGSVVTKNVKNLKNIMETLLLIEAGSLLKEIILVLQIKITTFIIAQCLRRNIFMTN